MGVGFALDGDVAVVTLERPEAFNAIDQSLTDGFLAAVARAGDEARAAVVTGAGRAFCAGADLASLRSEYDADGPDLERLIRTRFNPIVEALLDAPVPTVAAVNGAAAGAGMGVALACDLRVVSTEGYFMSAFVNVALVPDSGSSWFLPHMVGLSRATEIAMTGRRVEAQEAVEIGLAHRTAPPEGLLDEAVGWARRLSDGPREAYLHTRRVLRSAAAAGLTAALEEEARVQGDLGRRPAHLEGMRAFLEKRKPDFRS